jgi:7-cyano-7-deazaguanine synthase
MTQLEINFKNGGRPKHAVVSLSGGMDSSTLLLKCLDKFDSVTALSFDYGQKHKVELKRAKALVDYLKRNGHNVTYQVIELNGLVSLLNSALVEGGDDVPEGHYEQDNMKETVVPNRNKMFSSITQAVALSIANKTESPVKIAMGIHAGDHAIYPDCRQEFRDADYKAFSEGNWDAQRVSYYTPYLDGDKYDILKDGEVLCEKLGIEFDEVYARTNTSYKPTPEGWSDYKSASSVERIEAFIKLGRPDPVQYADETGAVDYETAKSHVEKVLAEYS